MSQISAVQTKAKSFSTFGDLSFETVLKFTEGNILFRVDAGLLKGLSTGHIFRCLSIAQYLIDKGHKVRFLTKDYDLGVAIFKKSGFDFSTFPKEENGFIAIKNIHWDTMIVDYPKAYLDFGNFPKHKSWIWIDDLGTKKGETIDDRVDVIINPSMAEENHFYIHGPKTNIFTGGDYFFPSRDFREIKKVREHQSSFDEVTVFMGGTDIFGYSKKVIPIVKTLGMTVNLIVGSGNPEKNELKLLESRNVKVFIAPENAAIIFKNTYLAVVTGGLLSYEMFYLGIPAVIVPSIIHEKRNKEVFHSLIENKIKGDLKGKWEYLKEKLKEIEIKMEEE